MATIVNNQQPNPEYTQQLINQTTATRRTSKRSNTTQLKSNKINNNNKQTIKRSQLVPKSKAANQPNHNKTNSQIQQIRYHKTKKQTQ